MTGGWFLVGGGDIEGGDSSTMAEIWYLWRPPRQQRGVIALGVIPIVEISGIIFTCPGRCQGGGR